MPTTPDLGSPLLNELFSQVASSRSGGKNKANPDQPEIEDAAYRAYEQGCKDLSKENYLLLQGQAEDLEMAHAKGQDLPGHELQHKVICEIMDLSPWTLHPDHGCVLKTFVEAERESQQQSA